MESLHFTQEFHQTHFHFMNKLSPKLKHTISLTSSIDIRAFCASSPTLTQTQTQTETVKNHPQVIVPVRKRKVKASNAQLKENWLASISYSFPAKTHLLNEEQDLTHKNEGSKWILGIDPDVAGAVALLKTDDSACSAQVFDSPHVQMLVGKRTRRRLDANSIVQLVRSFDAPVGTIAYIEQSLPCPQDGKQGWWSGGFGYGLWIGILVASGFSVVPVTSFSWKAKFELIGSEKDDSRRVACTLFPSLSSLLSRKKDHVVEVPINPKDKANGWWIICYTHSRILFQNPVAQDFWKLIFKPLGRAEALLIAAYGKDQNNNLESSSDTILEKLET